MPVRVTPALVALLALSACDRNTCDVTLAHASLVADTDFLEFGTIASGDSPQKTVVLSNTGDVALGISSIGLATDDAPAFGMPGAFQVSWSPVDVDAPCDQPVPTADGVALVLVPGARLPVTVTANAAVPGDEYDALIVHTADAGDDDATPPEDRVGRDPDHEWEMVYLHGVDAEAPADLAVSPADDDMGLVWPGDVAHAYVTLANEGDEPITLHSVALEDCSSGFALASAPAAETVLDGRTSTVVDVTYTPTDTARARCRVEVSSDDDDRPRQASLLVANQRPAVHEGPTIEIVAPEVGTKHENWAPVQLELHLVDPGEPLDTVSCKVKSSLQLGVAIADCTPDPTGHWYVDVPIDGVLSAGIDVLTVQVVDREGASASASVSMLIAASYPPGDDDGDGFAVDDPTWPDCDDSDPLVYPFATELVDGHDNDCDPFADEGTSAADDDGDGVSEAAGDCDDTDGDTFPGAPEQPDGADNDCDGTIDEGTAWGDDDGDGYSEEDLDCDDGAASTHPGAVEWCDNGADDDCNGLKDASEPCRAAGSPPMLVGGIQMSRTAVEVGGTVTLGALVYDPDGDPVQSAWSVEDDAGSLEAPSSATTVWTAPSSIDVADGEPGRTYKISYVMTSSEGSQQWVFGEVSVYQEGRLDAGIIPSVCEEPSTCE